MYASYQLAVCRFANSKQVNHHLAIIQEIGQTDILFVAGTRAKGFAVWYFVMAGFQYSDLCIVKLITQQNNVIN